MSRMVNRKNVNAIVRSAAVAATLLAGHSASAQITTWTGASPGSWSVAGNWNNGLPSGGGFTALVDAGNAATRVVTVDGNFTVGTLGITAGDQVQIGNNLTLNVNALLNNAGTLSINAAANASSLSTGGGSLLINGGGTIVLGGANAIIGNNGTLTNANNTIVGQGAIAGNGMFFINQGTVNANVNGGNIYIDPVAAGMTNSGTLTSSNGGTLRFNGFAGGGMTNTGTISAQNGSVTQFENSFGVSGGTFTSSGTGTVRTANGNTVNYSSINNLGNWTLGSASTSNYSGDLFNSGSINMAADGGNVTFNFNSGTTNLTGGGTINMSATGGGGVARIGDGGGRLVNVNNTIRGTGHLGSNNQRFSNNVGGLVNADLTGQVIFVDPVAEPDAFVNAGNMRATNGGLLQFTGQFGGGVTNTGTISASGANSEVQLFNSIGITGGTFTTSAGGIIRSAPGNTVNVSSITNAGNWTLDNNSTNNYSGDLLNSGSINFTAASGDVTMNFNSGTTNLTGNGTINMGSTGGGEANIGNGSGRLVNVNNFIRGSGRLGNNNQRFTNGAAGVVQADVTGVRLFVDPVAEADAFVNNGIMRATNGGLLQYSGVFGGGVTNNGTISASGAGSEVQFFNGIGILGGTYTTSTGGVIRVPDGQVATLQNAFSNANVVVGANSTLNLNPGTFNNSGSINLNVGTNTGNALNAVGGATMTLSGGGVVSLTRGTSGGASSIGGSGTLVTNNTIRGAGNIGNNAVSILNNGTISADVSGQAIFVDPVSAGGTLEFTNAGTMQATGGGILQFSGQFSGGVNNTSGRIIAQNGSTVQLFGNIGITGGTFNSAGTGAIEVPVSSTGFIANNANLGLFNVQNNATLNGAGTLLNNGTISVNAGTNGSAFNCNSGTLVITGTGQIILTTSGAGVANLGISGNAMDIGPSITVRGQGNIAGNNGAFTNRGTINADVNGRAIFVDPVAVANGFVNNNLMTATNGGFLQFQGQFGGGVTNNGTISAQNGSTVQLLGGAGISGGTFTTTGTGGVEVAAGNTGFIANNVNTGAINVQNNATMNGAGTLINNGSINVNPVAGNAFLQSNSGTWVITGTGTINLNAGTNGVAHLGVNGNGIDIGAGQVVRGRGNIAGNNGAIINRGLIVATGGGEIFVDPVAAADGFRNLNTIRIETGSQMRFNGQFGGGVNNAGAHIDVDPGATLRTEGGHGLSGGTITLDGTFNADSSSNTDIVNFRGNGTLNIANSARVGLQSGAGSVGTSRVTSLNITASGRLDLNDQDMAIDYTGASPTASLRPLIQAAYAGGAWNGNTTMITSTAANIAAAGADKTGIGYAEATEILGASPTSFNGVAVDATSTLLRYTLAGDSNLDFTVNITDFARLAANFNTPSLWYNGDFNYDGTTNITDFALLAANFNKTLAADLPGGLPRGSAVPEPAALSVLLGLAGLLNRTAWRRNQQLKD